jgi:hypothetical protein
MHCSLEKEDLDNQSRWNIVIAVILLAYPALHNPMYGDALGSTAARLIFEIVHWTNFDRPGCALMLICCKANPTRLVLKMNNRIIAAFLKQEP